MFNGDFRGESNILDEEDLSIVDIEPKSKLLLLLEGKVMWEAVNLFSLISGFTISGATIFSYLSCLDKNHLLTLLFKHWW